MRKNILNFSYAELHAKLKYKAMHMERLVLSVDPRYTTQDCSECGRRKRMKLSDREYKCECGMRMDRDKNSARNIKEKGKKSLRI